MMKKLILSALMLAFAALGHTQTAPKTPAKTPAEAAAPQGERSEWLPSFTAVDASGAFDIILVKVPDSEAPKITYDTRGAYTTRFRAEVKDKVLHISEKIDTRRTERTSVRVYYNELESLRVSDAAAAFEGTFSRPMFDMTVGGAAKLTAALDVRDLNLEVTGKSSVTLTGTCRYLTLYASTSTVEAAQLDVMSARVNAQSNASVTLHVSERLEAKASTRGSVLFAGDPEVVRIQTSFLSGQIKAVK